MKENKFNYFKAFCDFGDKACEAAEILQRTLEAFDPVTIVEHMDIMHHVEHEADDIKHTVIERLGREFVSPIEREDIVSLVQEFDNVVDGIDDVMREISMFRIQSMRDDVNAFTVLLVKACEHLRALTKEFAEFRKSKTLKDKLILVHTDESAADTLHFDAVSRLFSSGEDAVHIVAWQNIYDTLENCFDNCEHTAEVMESVILKNS